MKSYYQPVKFAFYLKRVAIGLFIIFVIFYLLSFLELRHEELALIRDQSIDQRRTAVIYALPTFHEEVVSSIACILSSLGYKVVVYIGNGVTIGSTIVPFSGRRKRSSTEFYGQCVSQWITIRPLMKIITNADILVFITYPMLQRYAKDDYYARHYLQTLQKVGSKTHVVYIVHRTNEMIHHTLFINEQSIPRSQSTYLMLGEHTYIEAKKEVEKWRDQLGGTENLNLAYIYPVLPLDFIKQPDVDAIRPTFALQGTLVYTCPCVE